MSKTERDLVETHLQPLMKDVAQQSLSEDVVGRILVETAIKLWRKTRTARDISEELTYTASHFDSDEFIRL